VLGHELSSIGVVEVLTRPMVIAMSQIQRSCRASSTELPWTPDVGDVTTGTHHPVQA
jgi:hypothetical protein